MTENPLRTEDYLAHMIEAIDRIKSYTQNKVEIDFENDSLLQDAVLRNLSVLGEAAKNVLSGSPQLAQQTSGVPFAKIYGMRNQLEHGYFTVDLGIVWNVVAYEIPALRPQLEILLHKLAHGDAGGPEDPR